MKVLVANADGDVKRGEILVPVRDPSTGLWLAGVSTGCESMTGEVVDIKITEQDIFAFQGGHHATMEDINWLCTELRGYHVGTEVGMADGRLYVIRRTEHGSFWSVMLIMAFLLSGLFFINPNGIQLIVTMAMWGCVLAYRHLR